MAKRLRVKPGAAFAKAFNEAAGVKEESEETLFDRPCNTIDCIYNAVQICKHREVTNKCNSHTK